MKRFCVLLAALFLLVSACMLHAAPLKDLDKDEWFSICAGGLQIGYMHRSIERTTLHGKLVYQIATKMYMGTKVNDTYCTSERNIKLNINEKFIPVYAIWQNTTVNTCINESSPSVEESSMVVESNIHDGYIDCKRTDNGKVSEKRIPNPEGVDLTSGCRYDLGLLQLSTDKPVEFYRFDEMISEFAKVTKSVVRQEKIEVDGKVYNAFITSDDANQKVYETAIGELIKIDLKSSNATIIKATKEEALKGAVRKTVADRIPVDLGISDDSIVTELKIRLIGMVDQGMAKEDARQKAIYSPNKGFIEYHITARSFDSKKSITLPVKDTAYAKWLAGTPAIQSGDAKIKSLAAKIVGNEKNAYKAACKIRAWVRNYRKGMPLSEGLAIPKSIDADTVHSSVIYAALARAAGIPTRIMSGMLYNKRAFAGHSWAEVYVGEWVPMDPHGVTDMADATHIKIFEEAITDSSSKSNSTGIVAFMANSPKIEVISVKTLDSAQKPAK